MSPRSRSTSAQSLTFLCGFLMQSNARLRALSFGKLHKRLRRRSLRSLLARRRQGSGKVMEQNHTRMRVGCSSRDIQRGRWKSQSSAELGVPGTPKLRASSPLVLDESDMFSLSLREAVATEWRVHSLASSSHERKRRKSRHPSLTRYSLRTRSSRVSNCLKSSAWQNCRWRRGWTVGKQQHVGRMWLTYQVTLDEHPHAYHTRQDHM